MAVSFQHNSVTCLSGDVKPTADPGPGHGFRAGYRLYETDTHKSYFWSGSSWENVVAPEFLGSGVATTSTFLNGAGAWATVAGGAGGGDNVTINTTALTDIDLDDATPAAPLSSIGKGTNVTWQHDASSPANVSAYVNYIPLVVKTTANFAKNSSVLSSVTGMSFTLTSGRFYRWEYHLLTNSDTTTIGVQLSVKTGAVTNFAGVMRTNFAADGAGAEWSSPIVTTTDPAIPTSFTPATSAQMLYAEIRGIVMSSIATALDLMIATETGVTTVSIKVGSVGLLYDYGTT